MKTTYFLGAGASYNAIPIVGELEKAFIDLEHQTMHLESDLLSIGLLSQFKDYQAHMQTGAKASKIFGTIDTYAKHLWLTNEHDLKALKESLSFFFCVWQEARKTGFNHGGIRTEHFTDIDPRYLGLFANYLEKDATTIYLNNDVKFITWNYDSQLERALSLFTNRNNLEQTLNDFLIYPYVSDRMPNVVHLNGIAGLYPESDGSIKTCFNKIQNNKNWINVLRETLPILTPNNRTNDKYFTFAWEDDDTSINGIKYAEDILKETEILVIIGYSFPTFNDRIDKLLLKALNESSKFKMVYYQDPNASKEFLLSRFGIPERKITIVKETSQFVLPLDSHNLNSSHKGYLVAPTWV